MTSTTEPGRRALGDLLLEFLKEELERVLERRQEERDLKNKCAASYFDGRRAMILSVAKKVAEIGYDASAPADKLELWLGLAKEADK